MRSAATLADRVALAVLAGFAAIALATFRDYGLGWDDYTHSQYGALLLALYDSSFVDTRALHFVNLYMYGGGFDMAAALAAKVLPFTLFETRRLAGALVGLVGFILIWRTGRRLGGPVAGPLTGLAALVALLLTPHYYGHVFINAKDAPFAVASLALLYAFVRAIDEFPRPSWPTVAIFGVGLGVAFGTRILAVVSAAPFVVAVAFLFASDARRESLKTAWRNFLAFFLRLLPALPLGIVVMGLLWPWSVLSPLHVIEAVEYFSSFFEKPWEELYEGRLISVPDMPASYVPHLFALKLPEGLLIFVAIGTALALWRIAGKTETDGKTTRANLLIVLVAAVLPIAIAVITRPAGYNGIRHFLFAVPPLALLAGLAVPWLLDRARRHSRHAVIVVALLFAAAILDPLAAMIRLHPYEYTYFNLLAGSERGARKNYMIDYWGLSLKQAADALRGRLAATGEAPPQGRRWTVAVCGPHPTARVALGDGYDLTWDPKGADFALMLGEFYCAKLDAPEIATVERAGVTYARVYDIRGREVKTILTQPPP
ncbi:MAG: ArnT family glycosyltransferase [Xanthobacteraceae bacterium]|uniref:ArnT family glycosyltransferase n=1 Tax=Pseudolabrys sp. TaxID=1960880 RepID=UPI003D151046